MEQIVQNLLDYGLLGAAVVVLGYLNVRQGREIKELQKEMRDTLREVLPAVDALKTALSFVERAGK